MRLCLYSEVEDGRRWGEGCWYINQGVCLAEEGDGCEVEPLAGPAAGGTRSRLLSPVRWRRRGRNRLSVKQGALPREPLFILRGAGGRLFRGT